MCREQRQIPAFRYFLSLFIRPTLTVADEYYLDIETTWLISLHALKQAGNLLADIC